MTITFPVFAPTYTQNGKYLRDKEGSLVLCYDPVLGCGAKGGAPKYEITISTQPFKGSKAHKLLSRSSGYIVRGNGEYLFDELRRLLRPLFKGKFDRTLRVYFHARAV
jgi:hypothetical protein